MARDSLKTQIMEALQRVYDPELGRDLVSLNMIKGVSVRAGRALVRVELTTPACPMKATIRNDIVAQLRQIPGVKKVDVEFSAEVRGPAGLARGELAGIKNVLVVASGKGGVGKSTVAALLAVGLAREGASVGLLDADIYGPSMPTIFGLAGSQPGARGDRMVPVEWRSRGGPAVKLLSVGFLTPSDGPIIWRGPMVHRLIRQFLLGADWGELDYLIADLPPGTGDVPLTLAQSVALTGAVVVATPQELALIDARRAVGMFAEVGVQTLGLVENMSYYVCPNCGHEDDIFCRGGAARTAEKLGVPFLGAIPINGLIRRAADEGDPLALFRDPSIGPAAMALVGRVAGQVSVRALGGPAKPVAGRADDRTGPA